MFVFRTALTGFVLDASSDFLGDGSYESYAPFPPHMPYFIQPRKKASQIMAADVAQQQNAMPVTSTVCMICILPCPAGEEYLRSLLQDMQLLDHSIRLAVFHLPVCTLGVFFFSKRCH